MRRAARRLFSSTAAPSIKRGGFFELRTDQIAPAGLNKYLDDHNATAAERQKLFPGWCGMWKTELGGSVHTVQHLYHWNDYDQRDRARAVAEDHPWWYDATSRGDQAAHDNMLPMPSLRQNITSSEAVVMIEATDALESCGLPGAAGFTTTEGGPNVAWELRKYQLVLGYTTMPRFLDLYSEGLKDKLAADDSGASQLATLLYSDSGSLNVVIELWRHESMQRAQDSRVASRKASKWKTAIGEIAQISTFFSTHMMRPMRWSPWR